MSGTSERRTNAQCYECDDFRLNEIPKRLVSDGWVRTDPGNRGWLCPRCVRTLEIMNGCAVPHNVCVYCGRPREERSEVRLRGEGWVHIGPGEDEWICAWCAARNQTSDKASGPPPAVAGDSAATPLLSTTPAYYLLPEGATRLWELIDALGMSHRQASAFEYVYRAGRKPGASKVDDLRKAVANLEYEIARMEEEPTP